MASMIIIADYMDNLVEILKQEFASRLLYVGLQGSYSRGEANGNSDIDIMVVLDDMQIADMDKYRQIILSLEHGDKSCGFICGRSELANWNACEIAHLVHTTEDYFGTLATLVPSYTTEDERTYIKVSAGNLYHEICHSYIHSPNRNNKEWLRASYKSVFFILQNVYYLRNGEFIRKQKELISRLEGMDKKVLATALLLKTQEEYDFEEAYSLLFDWCKMILQTI